jgi:hypothetical protein
VQEASDEERPSTYTMEETEARKVGPELIADELAWSSMDNDVWAHSVEDVEGLSLVENVVKISESRGGRSWGT